MLSEGEHQPRRKTTTAKERDLRDFMPAYVSRAAPFGEGWGPACVFMTANIKPLVDGTIRRVLLNKPWFFHFQRACVCVCVTGSVKRGNTKPGIKEATDGHRDLFGKSSMLVWVRGPERWFPEPQLGSNRTDFHKCEWAEPTRALASAPGARPPANLLSRLIHLLSCLFSFLPKYHLALT